MRAAGIEDISSPPAQAVATFTFPNRILFNWGARKLLASETARLGMTRPLVVTDPGLMAMAWRRWSPARSASRPVSSATSRPIRPRTTCSPAWRRYRAGRLRRPGGHRRWKRD